MLSAMEALTPQPPLPPIFFPLIQFIIDVHKMALLRRRQVHEPNGINHHLRRLLRQLLEGFAALPAQPGAEYGLGEEHAPQLVEVWVLALVPLLLLLVPQVIRFYRHCWLEQAD